MRPRSRTLRSTPRLLLPLALLLGAAACSEPAPEADPAYVETGDLGALEERGLLRILVPPLDDSPLRRHGYPIDHERELAAQLARSLGLEPRIVTVAARDRLLDALADGQGDLILARLTITAERRERFAFSVPLDYTREMAVVAAGDAEVAVPEDLAGRRVAVRPSSSFYRTLERLRQDVPDLRIVRAPESWDTEQILAGVAEGAFDATVADEDVLDAVMKYRDDLVAPFALTGRRPIGWAMRRDSPRLKAAVDAFLHEHALVGDLDPVLFGDLETVRERKVLRVLTRNNAAATYLHGGEQMGFEFELARRFARSIGCRLRLVIPPDSANLIDWLVQGRGDLIAASMTITPERSKRVAFSSPYLTVQQMVVARADDDELRAPQDMAGRTVTVRGTSAYHDTLEELRRQGVALAIEAAEESVETEELIRGVGEGRYDLTVADSHILEIELSFRDDVRGAFGVGAPSGIGWVMRPEDSALRGAVDGFFRTDGPGRQFFNVLREKYFTDARQRSPRLQERPEVTGTISPFDDLFRKYGQEFDIDWRLLAAQAYQESRFRPRARSHAGALGLMQVRPRTARSVGVTGDLRDPETGIRAGVLYLRKLADRYYPDLPFAERLRFALGAYNAGPGHVRDGRQLAREKGTDENVWFDSVEGVLPLLARREYARRARSGYCRCQEAVNYVREIHERYERYIEVVGVVGVVN